MPALAADDVFTLVAVADPAWPDLGVPAFASLVDLLAQGPTIDAVAIYTPPQMVAEARDWLGSRTIRSGPLVWRVLAMATGGFGVFDPAMNACSILTEITDAP